MMQEDIITATVERKLYSREELLPECFPPSLTATLQTKCPNITIKRQKDSNTGMIN